RRRCGDFTTGMGSARRMARRSFRGSSSRSPNRLASTQVRPRARRGEGERLRADILAAAERLLIERGDEDAVSIPAVAEAVGVSPPAIYLHFADKAELIFAVCEEQFRALDRAVERAARRAKDPLESLRRRGQAYVKFGRDHPEQYRILFMGKPKDAPPSFD